MGVKNNDFFYERMGPNVLLHILKKPDFATALAYICDNVMYDELYITPHKSYIEVSNRAIFIAIVIYVGFEEDEYYRIKNRKNLHIITLDEVVPEMVEFQSLNVKYIDKLSWLFMILSKSKNEAIKGLNTLKNLSLFP